MQQEWKIGELILNYCHHSNFQYVIKLLSSHQITILRKKNFILHKSLSKRSSVNLAISQKLKLP